MCLVEVLVLANYLHLMGPRSALIKRNIRSVHKQLSLPSVFLGQFKMQKDGEKQAKRTFSVCVGFCRDLKANIHLGGRIVFHNFYWHIYRKLNGA